MMVHVRTTKGFMITIRNFEMPDIRRVTEIEEQTSLDGDAGMYLDLYAEWPEGFLVAKKGGEIIAFEVVVLTPEGEGRIFALAVDSRYRGRGVGRALLNAAFSTLRRRKIGYVVLEVRVSNQIAQRLYRSMGFFEIGFIPLYYKDGEGAMVMRKAL